MHMIRTAPRSVASRQSGLTLIELMIGMLVSLLVLSALTAYFINGIRARAEMIRSNELSENGRYILQMLSRDLMNAGSYGEFDLTLAEATLDMPADLPDPCATDLADLDLAIPFHIQGFDGAGAVALNCIEDRKADTDVLVVRRLSTCLAGDAGCAVIAGAPYFQASRCTNINELLSPDSDDWFRLETDPALLNRQARDCATRSRARRFKTHIYFVANNDLPGDGVPTLKRAELGAGGFDIIPLANGVESLQFEYGIDNNGDATPDLFTAVPSTAAGCGNAACRIQNWRNVTAVRLGVLARSNTESRTPQIQKTFTLGRDAAGDLEVAGPYEDNFKRNSFVTIVALKNVVGRRR